MVLKKGSTFIETLFAMNVFIICCVVLISLYSSLLAKYNQSIKDYEVLQDNRVVKEKGYSISSDLKGMIDLVLQQ